MPMYNSILKKNYTFTSSNLSRLSEWYTTLAKNYSNYMHIQSERPSAYPSA